MRLLHSGDWHLGRTLHGANLLEDQAYLLAQVVDLARHEKPDAVIVAGDVYDRAVPPAEAVKLLDDTLCRLVLGLKVPVIVIAGNHDGADRLAFGSRLLDKGGLYILGQPSLSPACIVLGDDHGPVYLYGIPYAEPAVVRHLAQDPNLQGHQGVMRRLVAGIWPQHPKGQRAVLIAHGVVAGATVSESERPLSIGGDVAIEPAVFKGFHYVALGHLHHPQSHMKGRLRYCGSLMSYSFSEAGDEKVSVMAELDASGKCRTEGVPLSPRYRARRIEGNLADILAGAREDSSPEDYIEVSLLDKGPVFEPMARLREVYPNALHIERPALTEAPGRDGARPDHRKTGDLEMFQAFYEHVTGEELQADQQAAFVGVADEVRRGDREDAA